ncbi:hypothetical protein V6N11_029214 [Hibiscus sabdariffa]|uniref:Uncharacterized protein n=1 Tax=Hibiscus sabdariffa TaxID=183260 RepID=A0ABR1ZCW6_9ROSI
MSGNPNPVATGINSGRPPDPVISSDAPISLERYGSPVALSEQRAAKKGRSVEDNRTDTLHHDVESIRVDTPMMEVSYESMAMDKGGLDTVLNGQAKPSFRDITAGDVGSVGRNTGSRFSALSQLNETVVTKDVPREPDVSTSMIGSILARGKEVSSPHAESSKANSKDDSLIQKGTSNSQQHVDLIRQRNTPKDSTVTIPRHSFPIASPAPVKIVESSLSKDNHVAIQVNASVDNPNSMSRSGRVLPVSIAGGGGNKSRGGSMRVSKKGIRLTKKDPRSGYRQSLSGLVENLSTELERAQSALVKQGTELPDSLNARVEELTDFWDDDWLNFNNPLALECPFDTPPAANSVASFVSDSGSWDWDLLSQLLPQTRLIWLKLLPPRVLVDFLSLNLKEWLLANINQHGTCSRGEAEWPVRFAVFCWLAWKRRCSLLLDANYVDRGDFITHGLALAANYLDGFKSDPPLRNSGCTSATMWSCPRIGWVKLNADGSVDPRCDAAAAARLARGTPIGSVTFAEPPIEAAMVLSKDSYSL